MAFFVISGAVIHVFLLVYLFSFMANVNEASINYVADERHVALHHTGNVIFVACWGTAQRGKRATTTNTAR